MELIAILLIVLLCGFLAYLSFKQHNQWIKESKERQLCFRKISNELSDIKLILADIHRRSS